MIKVKLIFYCYIIFYYTYCAFLAHFIHKILRYSESNPFFCKRKQILTVQQTNHRKSYSVGPYAILVTTVELDKLHTYKYSEQKLLYSNSTKKKVNFFVVWEFLRKQIFASLKIQNFEHTNIFCLNDTYPSCKTVRNYTTYFQKSVNIRRYTVKQNLAQIVLNICL